MYFRLTYTTSVDKNRKGDCFMNGNKPMSIGQGLSCDVQLPSAELYEPQVFASVLYNESGDGWILVKRSDCCHIMVNGIELSIAQSLSNGDVISLTDDTVNEKFMFEMFDDGDYDGNSGIVYKKRQGNRLLLAMTIILSVFALGIATYTIVYSNHKNLRQSDWSRYSSSIYQITVDSVYLICDSTFDGTNRHVIVESIELQQVFVGTAFLCTDDKSGDTLFVTARHCVEPWINDDKWDGVSDKAKMSPEVRLATMAETGNRYAGYDKYILRAHCILSKGLERHEFYSTDFYMNKSRDLVMRLGTSEKPIYWRTIMPIAKRRDMELGDFAYINAKGMNIAEGNTLIQLAEWDEIVSFTKSTDKDIAVMGFPINDNEVNNVSVVYGNYMDMEISDSIKTPDGCLKLSAPINRGNSGGPVFAKIGNKIKAIGIVSKADGRADQGVFWSVPVTEVTNMHSMGDTINDTESYRR